MSENKEYNVDIDETVDNDEEIEFIDYDIDTVKVSKENDYLELDKPQEKTSLKDEIISFVKMFIFAAVAAFIINSFIIINATVPTGSMENTILAGDRIVGLRLSYMFKDPQRGDIAVFKYPLDESKNYVKRVIGLPGETVKIEDSKVYVYDTATGELKEELEENYLKEEWVVKNDGYTFVIPEDRYLMIGDNRNHSADVRDWQAAVNGNPEVYGEDEDIIYVHEDKILGKAYFAYWSQGKVKFKGLN